MQKLEPLTSELSARKRYACDVATRPTEAADKAELDRVNGQVQHDRNCRSRGLGGQCSSGASANNYSYLMTDQIGRQRRQSIGLARCSPVAA